MQRTNKMLTLAAIMTWLAAFCSEWFSLRGSAQLVFGGFAVLFISAFLWLDRQPSRKGYSLALCLQIVGACGAVYMGRFGITPALYVILGTVLVERLPRTQFWIVLILINLWLFYSLQLNSHWQWALSGLAAYVGFQMFGLLMASNASALAAANQNLMASNAELMAARSLLAESERASERLNLSRELHDVCGHKLTALKLTMRQANQTGSLSGEALTLSQQLADEILSDIRSVVSTLRTHEAIDLRSSLAALSQSWQKPTVELTIAPDIKVSNLTIAHTLLRIAQEATTNAAKHANAKIVQIELKQIEEQLVLSIRDDGKSSLPIVFGNGLKGMQERIAAHAGDLRIERNSDGALQLIASIPNALLELKPSRLQVTSGVSS